MGDDPLALIHAKAAAQRGGTPPKAVESKSLAPPADKHAICLQILTEGYVQSFVDFFYLTHKPEAPAASGEDAAEDRSVLPAEKLDFVQKMLTEAEAARRQSETNEVYQSYQALSELFFSMSDFKTSIYFREKCLEIAKLVGYVEGELLASRELGIAHEKLDNIPECIKFYEKAHQLAQGDEEASNKANRDLVQAYQRYAKACEESDELQLALEYHEKCVQGAVESGDKALIGSGHYYLGKCLERVKEPQQAIEHYKVYLELCKETGDNDGQGSAAFALASAYQQTGDIASAVTHLEAFIDLAQGTGQVRFQAEACNSLGVIHNKQGDARSAVHYFERFFELALSLGDRALIDKARTNLGIARGNLVMGAYVQVVTSDLSSLLKWKNRRVPFAEVAPRKQ